MFNFVANVTVFAAVHIFAAKRLIVRLSELNLN